MTEKTPRTNPVDWFLNASLLLLVAAVALSLALELLAQIWPWLLIIGLVGIGLWIAIVVRRARGQRW